MIDGNRGGRRIGGSRPLSGAIFLCAIASIPLANAAPALARFDRAALAALSTAAGGATVACAGGAGALFVNPAGLVSIGGLESYADYAEPSAKAHARETRLAIAGNAGPAICGLGWYRLAGPLSSEDFIAAGAARTLLAGTQGSYIAIGAAAVAGRTGGAASPLEDGGEWSPASADLGIVVRPLPAISFGYAAGNLFDRGADDAGPLRWGRTARWGVSYFWENTIVLSIARSAVGGETKGHFGVSARAALPVELIFGLSDGDATGGLRWTGSRLRAGVSFANEGADGVTWSLFCEGVIFAARERDWR